jgi:hypothetical protein
LIKAKFAKDTKATAALVGHIEDPDTWQKPLEKSLRKMGANEDKEILASAQKLLELVQSQKNSLKNYDVKIGGNAQGFALGDHAKLTNNFNEQPVKHKKH